VGTEARARVGLAALLVFTLWTFAEVFRGGGYPGPTLLGMLLAGGLAVVTRRLGRGASLSFVLSGVALAWYSCLVFAPSATLYGLPTPGAFAQLAQWVSAAAQRSSTDVAPAPIRPGYVLMVVVGMWIATSIGETAAFRWQRPLLATLPCIALFCLVLIVGTGTAAPFLVAVFLALLLTFWGLESSNRLRSWGRWVPTWPGHPEEPPPEITGSLARRMAAWCVAGAICAPILLPLGNGLIDWRNGVGGAGTGGFGSGTTVDPLVSIAPTLVNQTNQELMQVKAPEASYWRVQTLAAFDGVNWSAASSPTRDVIGPVPLARAPARGTRLLTQDVTLTHLRTQFLPAAVNPVRILFRDLAPTGKLLAPNGLRADPETGDMEVEDPASTGFSYRVQSAVPQVTYNDLLHARAGDPGAVYLQLPDNLSQAVVNLAHEWTFGALTPLEKLLAIQRHLRRFRYSLHVARQASSDYLRAFLTKIKAGYCQQFATAFTILARIAGLPTRIAVGFLPGSQSARNRPFIVRGTDAHAWPEVHFRGYGWLRFEPTPRLAAAVPSYSRAPSTPGGGGVGSTGRRGGVPGANRLGRLNKAEVAGRTGGGPVGTRRRTHHIGRPEWEKAFTRFGRVLILLTLLVLVAIPLLKAARTARRFARARSAREVTEAAFAQFEDDAAELAGARVPSESAPAYVDRLVAMKKLSGKNALRLSRIYESAEYSPRGVADSEASEARRLVRQLRIDLWSSASWLDRGERVFSPKTLTRRL
jgi:transglutaminase-like putative cysteine protease